MGCLRCGFPRDRHCRADGSCLDARCEALVERWPEPPTPAPIKPPLSSEK